MQNDTWIVWRSRHSDLDSQSTGKLHETSRKCFREYDVVTDSLRSKCYGRLSNDRHLCFRHMQDWNLSPFLFQLTVVTGYDHLFLGGASDFGFFFHSS